MYIILIGELDVMHIYSNIPFQQHMIHSSPSLQLNHIQTIYAHPGVCLWPGKNKRKQKETNVNRKNRLAQIERERALT
ncbi:hypothetical protein XENTR_v10016045 [Xenopus tropicalis]|nr:hypothetical protein XENTR_v10016045 [Xenopus tropicalis]